jgi:shikimate dehydrogenase
VYNPAKTKLLLDAQERGIAWENGLWMLIAQAKEAAEYFTGQTIEDSTIGKIHGILRRQMENVVLVGMPGCGKSTIGKLVAEKTGKRFVDADSEIERLAQKTIPEIFAAEGEVGFRNWETKALSQIGQQSGLVIATGGGCVTKAENLPLLRQNGAVFWIQRDIGLLPKDGRPLSLAGNLQQMYEERKEKYRAFAHWEIKNDGLPEQAAHRICEIWEEMA